MDLKRWNHLVVLAEEGNFRRAAERVNLSQPALSRSIQAAEVELRTPLFERGTTRVRCTSAGAFIVERAKRLINEHRQLERDVRLFGDKAIGDLAFGMGLFAASSLLPPLLDDLRRHFPLVRVRAHSNNARYLFPPLIREELDFIVADLRYAENPGDFVARPLGQQPGAFYVRKGHPLLVKPKMTARDLVPYGLAMSWVPQSLQKGVKAKMGLADTDELPVALDCDDVHLVKRITLASDIVMLGSPSFMNPELAAGELVALEFADFKLPSANMSIISLRGRSFSPLASYASAFIVKQAESWAQEKPPAPASRRRGNASGRQ